MNALNEIKISFTTKVVGHIKECNSFSLNVEAIKESTCNLHEVAHTCANYDDVAHHH